MDPSNCCSLCPLSRVGGYFPRASSQAEEMLPCRPLEDEQEAGSEEREDSYTGDPKEIVTLAFVREDAGAQKGLPNVQQQGKKKRKKKRLGLKDGKWGSMSLRAEGRGTWRGRGLGCQ